MDEVDGRPGAVARKSGHLDAFNGVPPLSLSLPSLSHKFNSNQGTIPRVQGENHENVPGK
jgi:hypothetical protein